MLSLSYLILLLIIYIAVLFAIAQWAQSNKFGAQKVRNSANTYALSLAVFCTAWTFFGNVSVAMQQGLFPVALYLGSTITFIFMTPLLKKMVLLKNEFHSTSIADFISVRYNRSQTLAALISVLCLLGVVPYLTIQLKSVINGLELLVVDNVTRGVLFDNFDLLVVLMMAFFTISFGVRHLDPTERHPGMMVALAFENVFKLFAILIAGLWICYVMNPGLLALFSDVERYQQLQLFQPLVAQNWLGFMLLGGLGIMTLPRLFHVGIVECSDVRFIDRARWLFPLYLLVINLFALPVALAGMQHPQLLDQADLLLLSLPMSEQALFISGVVFLGGFAAATGMVMISAMTLSTMLTNHIVVPLLVGLRLGFLLKYAILQLRWLMVLLLLFLSLLYYRVIGDSELIVHIGVISFIACAQFAPALIGGLIWKNGNLKGAIVGLVAGACIWFYCSMLPSVIRSGWLDWQILQQSQGFFYWFGPERLFAIEGISTMVNSLFWSLLVNSLLYVGVSACTKMSDEEYNIAHQFVDTNDHFSNNPTFVGEKANVIAKEKQLLILRSFAQYMPTEMAEQKLLECLVQTQLIDKNRLTVVELSALKNAAVNELAGVIGMASAYHAFATLEFITEAEQQQLTSCFSQFFAQMHLSPSELFEQVNFYQEKRALLENHAKHQLETINQLESEINQRVKAEQTVSQLNEALEQKVMDRTQALLQSNNELNTTLNDLRKTQVQLLETEKMASLGQLVAGVGREVNAPIGNVLMSISWLKDETQMVAAAIEEQTLTPEQLDSFIDELNKGLVLAISNIHQAVKLVDSFKQVALDSSVDEMRSFNLFNYLQDILLSIEPQIKHSDIHFYLDCSEQIEMYSYPGAIAQITNHLVINSITHAFPNQQQGQIRISVRRVVYDVELIFSDDGCPLDENTANKLFEPFYTTKREQGGSGMGGYIIYNLVTQKLKGTIELLTDGEKGKSFKIRLPLDIH